MRKHWGILAVVLVLAACGEPAGTEPGTQSGTQPGIASETRAVPVPAPTGPGDMAPHEVENRGWAEPSDLSEETTRKLTADAAKLKPALAKVQAAHDYRPESTAAVLVAAGYPKESVYAQPSAAHTGVVFGVPDGQGCLVDNLGPGGVDIDPRGIIKEWGCGVPVTH